MLGFFCVNADNIAFLAYNIFDILFVWLAPSFYIQRITVNHIIPYIACQRVIYIVPVFILSGECVSSLSVNQKTQMLKVISCFVIVFVFQPGNASFGSVLFTVYITYHIVVGPVIL